MMNLQLFAGDAEVVQGKQIVYLYRLYSERSTENGALLAFVTENENSASNDAESTATKDGAVRAAGVPEIEITSTSLLKAGDANITKFKNACKNGSLVECWEANLADPGTATGKYKGTYYQGYITEFTVSSNADGNAEVSITYGANGKGADGEVTVSTAQIEEASYVFADTPKVTV